MKVACVLALCLVAVSGSFTGLLRSEVQPLLRQASSQLRVAALSARTLRPELRQFQSDFITALQQTAESLISSISEAMASGQEFYENIVQSITDTIEQLQASGMEWLGNAQQSLQNLISNLLTNLSGLRAAKQMSESLVAKLSWEELLQQTLEQIMTPAQIQALLDLLNQMGGQRSSLKDIGRLANRGLWDMITGPISQLTTLLSNLIQVAQATAGNTYLLVHTLVSEFLSTAHSAGSAAVHAAADKLLAFLGPFEGILGPIHDMVVDAVHSITGLEAGHADRRLF